MKPKRNAIQTSLIVALLIVAFAVLELFSYLPSTQPSVALANTQNSYRDPHNYLEQRYYSGTSATSSRPKNIRLNIEP
jgi:hypothetical protein